MASCVRNIYVKYYQNLIIGFKLTVENVGDAFLGHSVQRYFLCYIHSGTDARLFQAINEMKIASKLHKTIKKTLRDSQMSVATNHIRIIIN